jgi:hypothetical protein
MERSAGERGKRGRELSSVSALLSLRQCADAVFQAQVFGSGNAMYTVRIAASCPTGATCTCPDFLKRSMTCKHVIAAMLALLKLSPSQFYPAAVAENSRAPTALGTSAIRALRDAELEVVRLRADLAALQQRLVEAADKPRGTVEVRRLTAGATLEEWSRAIVSSVGSIRLACFTFDLPAAVEKLQEARKRDVVVKLFFSYNDRLQTKNQIAQLQVLRSCGCSIRAWRGCRMHAKWLLTERVLILGSCNFSTCSQRNVERGCRISGLGADEIADEAAVFDQYFELCSPFEEGLGVPAPLSPQR